MSLKTIVTEEAKTKNIKATPCERLLSERVDLKITMVP